MQHLSKEQLETGLEHILQSPKDKGQLDLICRRPAENKREVLSVGQLNKVEGLAGDNWQFKESLRTHDGSPHPDMQLNIMNSRVIDLVAQTRDRWQLAGDQLFIDMDLSKDNLPAGTQLSIGEAVIEVTQEPHTGCEKFVERFGKEAMLFVNGPEGKKHCLRGINARVVKEGRIQTGDRVSKIS